MDKFFDFNHPFFRPLWLRILIVAACLLWAMVEAGTGEMMWAILFAAHAASMGAEAVKVSSIAELEQALSRRHEAKGPYVVVIDTDPYPSTPHGGFWWDVAVPEVSERKEVRAKRTAYEQKLKEQVRT